MYKANENQKHKTQGRVFAMCLGDVPNVDTMIGILLVISQLAWTLFDTGATLSYVSEEFVISCSVHPMFTDV